VGQAVIAADRVLRWVKGNKILAFITGRAASPFAAFGCNRRSHERVRVIGCSARPVCAAAVRASCNWAGNFLPRFAARRRIPEHAFALKKYRCGTTPVSSVCDNEHTATALGDSKPLSVKNSVCEPIPEFAQRPEEGAKIPSFATTEDARDVFPNDPFGLEDSSKLDESEGQVATRVIQATSQSCD
jgi:hypothetical protein